MKGIKKSVVVVPTPAEAEQVHCTLATIAPPVADQVLVFDLAQLAQDRQKQGATLLFHARDVWDGEDGLANVAEEQRLMVWAVGLPGTEKALMEGVNRLGNLARDLLGLLPAVYLVRVGEGAGSGVDVPASAAVLELHHCSTKGEHAGEGERLDLAACLIAASVTSSATANHLLRALEEGCQAGAGSSAHACTWVLDRAGLGQARQVRLTGWALQRLSQDFPRSGEPVPPVAIPQDAIVSDLSERAGAAGWADDLASRANTPRHSLLDSAVLLREESEALSARWTQQHLDAITQAGPKTQDWLLERLAQELAANAGDSSWLAVAESRLSATAGALRQASSQQGQEADILQDKVGLAALEFNRIVAELDNLSRTIPPVRITTLGLAAVASLSLTGIVMVAGWFPGVWQAWAGALSLPAISAAAIAWQSSRLIRSIDQAFAIGRRLLLNTIAPGNLQVALHLAAAQAMTDAAEELDRKAGELQEIRASLAQRSSQLLQESEVAATEAMADRSRFVRSAFRRGHLPQLDPTDAEDTALITGSRGPLAELGFWEGCTTGHITEAVTAEARGFAASVAEWEPWDFVTHDRIKEEVEGRWWVHPDRTLAGHWPVEPVAGIFVPAPPTEDSAPFPVEVCEGWAGLAVVQVAPGAVLYRAPGGTGVTGK